MQMNLIRSEDGYTTVLFSVVILVMLALTGLIIDSGMLMLARMELDDATEIAVESATLQSYDLDRYNLDGTYDLLDNEVEAKVYEYLNKNMDGVLVTAMFFHPTKLNEVTVTTQVDVETHFMKIFGKEKTTIKSEIRVFIHD